MYGIARQSNVYVFHIHAGTSIAQEVSYGLSSGAWDGCASCYGMVKSVWINDVPPAIYAVPMVCTYPKIPSVT